MAKLKTFNLILIALSVVFITIGTVGLSRRYKATHSPRPQIPLSVVTKSVDAPEETKPVEACASYKVADGQPRKIEINSIGVSACIQRVGLDQNNAIAVPSNIHLAGWYVDSPAPGKSGVSIIDGHVSGRYNDAVFVKLATVKQNDPIRVQMGDMSWVDYRVSSVASYDLSAAGDALFKQLPGVSSQLTLITCGGKYDSKNQSFDKRVIVRAAKI